MKKQDSVPFANKEGAVFWRWGQASSAERANQECLSERLLCPHSAARKPAPDSSEETQAQVGRLGFLQGTHGRAAWGRPARLGKPCPSYCTNETVWEGRQCSQRLQTSGGWITYTQKTPPPHCRQEQGATRINHIHRQTKRGSDIPEQKTWWKGTIKLCEKPSSKEIVETEQYFEIYIIHILWWVHNKIRIADVKKEPGYKK